MKIQNKNAYYELQKETLTESARNRSYSKNGKAKSKMYYENNKKNLQKQARESYGNVSEEVKTKKKTQKKFLKIYIWKRSTIVKRVWKILL